MTISAIGFTALLSMSSSTTTKTKVSRDFQFVKYGESFSSTSRPTISCDGRIPGGVTLELTHWNGNETPDHLYADTSTEMALNLAKMTTTASTDKKSISELDNALVLNNHFDTDGVLSVWACIEPELALEYADLLVRGAEAGDFGEWNSDEGVKLDCALCGLLEECDDDDKLAYEKALADGFLPSLLQDLQSTGGESHEHLWQEAFEDACDGWKAIEEKKVTFQQGPGKMVLLTEDPDSSPLSPYALHRGLVKQGLADTTNRILRSKLANKKTDAHKYYYEKTGHGWVNKLRDRKPIPPVDSNKVVEQLNSAAEGSWKTGGVSGLVAICSTSGELSKSPEEVAMLLSEVDEGSR